ncbi:MAG TPA: T9SS type A sorting domain-containing protein, partial [Bacteroidia bacterium]|nr:T9SS type A sorting domain-containing protein [Bacteroidia bacterium]
AAAFLLCCPDWSGGGGGGSSYVNSSAATLMAHTQGYQTGNGLVTITYIITGNNEQVSSSGIKVFPNPAGNQLAVISWQLAISEIEIFDAFGRQVFSQRLTTNDKQKAIDVSGFVRGVYFARVQTEKGIRTAMFVKE